MSKNKEDHLESTNKRDFYSRRKMLSFCGIAGISVVSNSAIAKGITNDRKANSPEFKFHSNIVTMKQDTSLKEGSIVQTSGYYNVGDGGNAEYLVIKESVIIDEGEFIRLQNDLTAKLINVNTVDYRIFGAKGDKQNDDGIQIKAAHAYANKINVPVINLNGEYWVKQTDNIEIKTSVDWGNTIFHINEKYNTKTPRFRILSQYSPITVKLTPEEKSVFLNKFKPGISIIPELAPYKNSLVIIFDENDRIGFRGGDRYGGKISQKREELFYVEEHGRIIGDIAWTFKDYTSFTSYPVDESYLTIQGGVFYVSGDNPETKIGGSVTNGIQILRSRTIIRNQWVGLEKGKHDIALVPRNGFYNFSKVYDVTLENIRLIPWEKQRADKSKSVPEGTYGIGGSRMLNVVFRNITAEGSRVHWGVFGTNLNKNFRIENCKLNRVDVHFHCWNLSISNSEIGYQGIVLTGGGDLLVENTKSVSNIFLSFRRDYGGKWDGNISVKNCKLTPNSPSSCIFSFPSYDFNYGYPIGYAHKIKVEDFIINNSVVEEKGNCWLIRNSAIQSTKLCGNLFFPQDMVFKNISTEGGGKGVRLMQMRDPKYFAMQKKGISNSVEIIPNSRILFENIELENIELPNESHISIPHSTGDINELSLIPLIRFKECHNISGDFGGNATDLQFENCTIDKLLSSGADKQPGSISFNNCKFKANLSVEKNPYALSAELGTTFTNCIIYAPKIKNQSKPELLYLIDFLQINKTVKYNHLNTRLGNDILLYLKNKGTILNINFINMLKCHHELEA